jgi:hypothetical protein
MLYIATDFLSCFHTPLNTFLIVMPTPVHCFAINVMIPFDANVVSILVVVLTVLLVTSYKSMFVSLILVRITLIQQCPLSPDAFNPMLLLRRHKHCTK